MVESIERYLGSGMVRGNGPVYAKRLVHAFGENVIKAYLLRLREVHRTCTRPAYRRRLGRAKGRARDHAVPACPRRWHEPGD